MVATADVRPALGSAEALQEMLAEIESGDESTFDPERDTFVPLPTRGRLPVVHPIGRSGAEATGIRSEPD